MSRWSSARSAAFAVVPFGVAAVCPVQAQDAPKATVAEAPANQPADWSGPYLGLSGSAGGDVGRYRLPGYGPAPASPGLSSGFGQKGNGTPWAAGGHAGYQWQSGIVVFGLEGSLAAAPLTRALDDDFGTGPGGRTIDGVRFRRDVTGAVRGRLGFSVDDFLLYASFGLAASDQRVRDNLIPGRWRSASETFGPTYGFGIEAAISAHLSLGVDYRRSTVLDGNGTAATLLGLPKAKVTTDDVMARLTWYPQGLRLAPEAQDAPPGTNADWSLHGQTTFIQQATPRFRSPYSGDFSFLPRQSRETWSLSAYIGRKLWDGAELYYNPELNQGFGLSQTLGIAGYVNGEAQKAGAPYPKFRSQRYFIRQVIGLGGETESVPDGLNQIAGSRDIDRITITVGKFAVGDFFDDNAYAHDSRTTFSNWSLWAASAYDFPANLPGFTQGAVVELNRKDWALRAGAFQVPKDPNSDVLDPRITQKGGLVVEFEQRYDLFGPPGKLRLGAFTNVGRTASYREALGVSAASLGALDPNDAVAETRSNRRKSGIYANLEQAVTPDIGIFARASYNDGKTQILSFTDIDRSVSGGFAFKGTLWDREKDTIGIGAASNFLSRPHRDFLAAGGLGLLIGDGTLRYSPERALETYYKLNLADAVDLTLNYQFVANPGYNADRGPANVFGARLHAEF